MIPVKHLEIINLRNESLANPFDIEAEGRYFVYYYGFSVSNLSNEISDFSFSKLGKSGQISPNLALIERVAIKSPEKRLHLFYPDEIHYLGDYYVFSDKRCEGIVSTLAEAIDFAEKNTTVESSLLIGKRKMLFHEFPPGKSQSPFDKESQLQNFIYLTARQYRYSFLFGDDEDCSFARLSKFFTMGYTNLWQMKRLALMDRGKIEGYKTNTKDLESVSFYVMDANGIVEEFSNLDNAKRFLQDNLHVFEQLIISRSVEQHYWH